MTYYIDYKVNEEKKIWQKVRNTLWFRFSVIDIDKNKKCIYINKKYIKYMAYKKLNRYLIKHNLEELKDNALIAKEIKIDNRIDSIKYIPKEKYIMKAMIYDILKYTENILNVDFRNECIYVSMINENNKDILFEILDMFSSINIVTTRIGCMRRAERSILKRREALISISNNKRKALKRAKILINIDFSDKLLNDFEINRNCIIINLNNNKISLKSSFQGSIIDAIHFCYKNRYEEHINKDRFETDNLYNSYIQYCNYGEAIRYKEKDNCRILDLIGNRGVISNNEILNNYTNSGIKLDKIKKKD